MHICSNCSNAGHTIFECSSKEFDKFVPDIADRLERRATYLMWKYGMTLYDFDLMYEDQNGQCWICWAEFGDPEEDWMEEGFFRNIHIDHDHATGIVRGLLCPNCNKGLGNFKDSYSRLSNAIAYLFRFEDTRKQAKSVTKCDRHPAKMIEGVAGES